MLSRKQAYEFPSRIIPATKTQNLAQRLAEQGEFQSQHWALGARGELAAEFSKAGFALAF
ncbi:MAG: hypothetical protein L0Z50_03995 [Verrucomicrobiales bacterium]|nr:hypothetical protein [Verrucomicrobiales bacterium]